MKEFDSEKEADDYLQTVRDSKVNKKTCSSYFYLENGNFLLYYNWYDKSYTLSFKVLTEKWFYGNCTVIKGILK